jgi:hypothetical protein
MDLIQRTCGLANYADGVNPLEDSSLENYDLIKIDVTRMTREALKEFTMGTKEKTGQKICSCLGFCTGCITGIWRVQHIF